MILDIKETKISPRVCFNQEESLLEISGESYPENSFEFYEPVFQWLEEELPKQKSLTFSVNISYMNSSSTKCMLDILDILGDQAAEGVKIRIRWYYEEGNDRAFSLAEEFTEDTELPFEIIPVAPHVG